MRRFVRFAGLVCVTSPLACSDPSFDTAAPTEDDAAALDADAANDTASADADAANDTASADAGDAEPDDASDADASCASNACGGCATLDVEIGAPCGKCGGGTWACDGPDATTCEGATPTNACGGCDPLPGAPGAACGECGNGTWVCAGEVLTCEGATKNACGGCATLAAAPGTICGKCGSGTWKCDGADHVVCDDPVPASSPAPGTACGTCGTKKVTCTSDGKDTTCAGPDDVNACGGCGTLAGVPGAACGSCGKWTCSADKSSVSCAEATPAVGASCGICGKSSYACTGLATTTCTKPDDRLPYLDADADTPSQSIEHASHKNRLGFSYVSKRGGHITNVRLRLVREPFICGATMTPPHPDPACSACLKLPEQTVYICGVPEAARVGGSVTLSIYAGTPAIGMTSLTSITLPSDALAAADGVETWVDFTPPAPIAIAKDAAVFFELSTDSTAYQFRWSEAGWSPAGSTFVLWRKSVYPAGSWESQTRMRGVKVDILSCADF